jgi:hypothetical protein
MFAAIFIVTEFVADALLVYLLVEYFEVPMLRLPAEKFEWRSGEFWMGVMEIALVPIFCACIFLHAYLSATEWLAWES